MMLRQVVQRSIAVAARRPLVPSVRRVVATRYSSSTAANEDPVIFTKDYPELLTGPFGTRDKPVVVPSVFSERLVGCVGPSKDHEHLLLWHNVKADKPTICLECGQTFVLKQIQDDHHHDDHGHGHAAEHGHGAHGKDAHHGEPKKAEKAHH